MFLIEKTGEDLVADLARYVISMSDEAFESFVNGGKINEKITYVDREEWENAPEDEKGRKLKFGQGRYYVYNGETVDKVELLSMAKTLISEKDKNKYKYKIISRFFSVENFRENVSELVYRCSPEIFDMIIKILSNKELKAKFLDFENNKELFKIGDFDSQVIYITIIKRLFHSMDNDGKYKDVAEDFLGEDFQQLAKEANELIIL